MVQAWDTEVSEGQRQQMDLTFDVEGTGTQFMPSDGSHHVWKLTGQSVVGGRPCYRFSIRAYRNQWSDEEMYAGAAEVQREASIGIVATVYRDGVKNGVYLFCEAECEQAMPSLAGVWRAVLAEEPSPDRLAEDVASLEAFLADGGPPPVAVVWGSMLAKGGPAVAAAVRALLAVEEAGQRAVVLGGWAELDVAGRAVAAGDWQALLKDLEQGDDRGEEDARAALRDETRRESLREFARTRCCFVSSAPHTWLFPKCYCVVHHGGAGTTRACLYAGKPCIVTPVAFDQFYWADTVEALGVGYRVGGDTGFPAVRAHELAVVISEVPLLEQKAEEVGTKVLAEPGVVAVAEALSADVPNAVIRFDQNGKGVGVLAGMRYFFKKSAPPPVPNANPWGWFKGRDLGTWLKLHGKIGSKDDLDKKAWLEMASALELEGEAGTVMPSPHDKQILQVMTARPGLMCLVGQLPGTGGEKMYFALSKSGAEGSDKLPLGKCVPLHCLQLRMNQADSAGLLSKVPGQLPSAVKIAQGILLSPAGPALGSGWWQKALSKAKRDMVIGSLDVQLRAQLIIAAVAIHEGGDSAAVAMDALRDAVMNDSSVSVRRVAIELMARLGGLELADPIVRSAAQASAAEMQEDFVVVRVPHPAAAEGRASPTSTARQQAASDALRKIAAGGGSGGGDSEELRVCVLSDGSRGDVQPVLHLAQQLQAKGCKVNALVRANVVDLFKTNGVDASPAYPDLGFMMHFLKGVNNFSIMFEFGGAAAEWTRLNPDSLVDPLQVMKAFKPNAVLCMAYNMRLGLQYEDMEGVPAVPVACSGIGPTSYSVDFMLTRRPLRPFLFTTSKFLDSPAILGGKSGWHQSGAWLNAEEPTPEQLAEEPLASLAAFLVEGPPPVAVGWGSMLAKGVPAVAMLVRALMAVQEVGQRAVVIGGWAKLDDIGRTLAGGDWEALLKELGEAPPEVEGDDWGGLAKKLGERASGDGLDDVRKALRDHEQRESLQNFARTKCCFVASAPHTWLFPRCCCAVHHGGAGTTHACLYAGKPCVITPIWCDQWHWAATVEKLGVGRGVGGEAGLPAVRAGALADAIRGASSLKRKAEALGAKMRAEPGVSEAAEVFYKFLSEETSRGRWRRQWQAYRED